MLIAPTTVRAEVVFKDAAGTAFDPATVTFTLKPPSGASQIYTGGQITKTAVGAYRVDVDLTAPGVWHWRWHGSGPVQVASEGSVPVTPSKVIA